MFSEYQYDAVTGRHSFLIHDVDLAIVSALRRTIMMNIPIVGFHGEETPSFRVLANTGRLHNEIILHRFGLLPLCLTEEETEAFAATEYSFQLHVKNAGDGMLNVTTHDFTGRRGEQPIADKDLRRMFPAHPVSKDPILLTRLRPGEELHVEGAPAVDTGSTHAGFMPVSLCAFSFLPDAEKAAAAKSPLDKERAYARNKYGDPTGFRFELEPVTGLSPRYLVLRALELLIKRLETIRTELFQAESDKVQHGPCKGAAGYEFKLLGEDDTMGSLLQSLMYNAYIREAKETATGRRCTYVGYYVPHPLQRMATVKVVLGGADGGDVPATEYLDMFANSIQSVIVQLQAVQAEWHAFAPKTM